MEACDAGTRSSFAERLEWQASRRVALSASSLVLLLAFDSGCARLLGIKELSEQPADADAGAGGTDGGGADGAGGMAGANGGGPPNDLGCSHACAAGSFRCAISELWRCVVNENGCRAWGNPVPCEGATPVCSTEHGRCECDPNSPTACRDVDTPEACVDGVWQTQSRCAKTTTCIAGVGCDTCTEHEQCPDSACRVIGAQAGSCADSSDVVEATTPEEISKALGNLGDGERVIRIAGGTYDSPERLVVKSGQRVTLLGDGTAVMRRVDTPLEEPELLHVESGGLLVLSNVQFGVTFLGLQADANSTVWIEDVVASDVETFGKSKGDLYIRRSRISNWGSTACVDHSAGELHITNSSLLSTGSDPTLRLSGSLVHISYSTFVGPERGLSCDGASSGTIRNSIIVTPFDGNETEGCAGVDWFDNAVTASEHGVVVGPYAREWFVDVDGNDLHLLEAGATALEDIADWDEGDPEVDIDGDPRPHGRGLPGFDEFRAD